MTPPHYIRRFTAEVRCAEPDLALDLQTRIPGMVQGSLSRAVEEVMDAVCPVHETVRMRRLVVDLGHIPPERFEEEMILKIKETLKASLEKEIALRRPVRSSGFEQMAGRLFEIIQSGSHQNIDPYWIPLTAAYGRELTAALKRRGKSPVIRKHIAWLFPTERVKEMVRLFEPYHHGFITYFLDRPEQLMAKERLRAETPGTFKRQVTEFILAYLLVEQGSRFNKKIFLSSVISQISSHYNIRYQGLLTSLILLFKTSGENSPVRKEILEFLLELERSGPEPEVRETEAFSLEAYAAGSGRVAQAHVRGLSRLMMTEPGTVTRFLSEHRSDPRLVRRLAAALDEPGLTRLVDRIHPGKSNDVFRYARALDQAYYARLYAGSEKRARVMVWEAVLAFAPPFEERGFCRALVTHLARNRESGRDRHRFYSRLIIRLVLDSRKNREHYDLLRAVLELRGIRSGLELLRENGIESLDNALAFFRHYLARSENRRRMAVRFPKERIEKLIRLVLPFEHEFVLYTMALAEESVIAHAGHSQGKSDIRTLIHTLALDFLSPDRTGSFSRKNFVAALIRNLGRKLGGTSGRQGEGAFKAQLLAFKGHVERQRGKTPLAAAIAGILDEIGHDVGEERRMASEENSAKSLVMIYLTRILPDKGNETSYLMNAVRRYEGRVLDPASFYAAVLDKLIRRRTIDFEALLASDAKPKQGAVPGKTERGKAGFRAKILGLMETGPTLLIAFIRSHLSRPGFAALLVSSLMETELNRLVFLMRPRAYVQIKGAVEMLEKGVAKALGRSVGKETARLVWLGVFSGLSRSADAHDLDLSLFVRGFLETVSGEAGASGSRNIYGKLSRALENQSVPASGRQTRQAILDVLAAESARRDLPRGEAVVKGPVPAKESPSARFQREERTQSQEAAPVETIYLDNAGLVLAAPYLTALFRVLELVSDSRFKGPGAAVKGIRVLQYMADPEDGRPISQLVLNRILCGIDPPLPQDPGEALTGKEKETVDSLIRGMIENWKTIGNTSVQGFRESFLRRSGRLTLEPDNCWHLRVEARAFDMLLDSLPWQFSTVRLPWMSRLVYVKWR